MKTLIKWGQEGFPIVSQQEADRRAAICKTCPLRQPEGQFETAIKRKVFTLMRALRKDAFVTQKLGKCGVCHCYLDAKIWVDGPLNLEGDKFPDHCWCV